jgi:hypothetical protein
MEGSFGNEKEHYEVSMKVCELVLFPTIMYTHQTIIITASDTSYRHEHLSLNKVLLKAH